jgi:hypothetical protein
MTEVFADTFYWLAVLNIEDADHERVATTPFAGTIVTNWAVQLEVMDAFSNQRSRALAVGFWESFRKDSNIVVVVWIAIS